MCETKINTKPNKINLICNCTVTLKVTRQLYIEFVHMYVQFKNCTQKIKSHVNNMAEIALGNNPALLSFM